LHPTQIRDFGMKKVKLGIIILAGVMTFCLTACNSMESDAKKVAKRAYEIEKVYERLGDRSNLSGTRESKEQKIREYMDFANKMLEKHGKDRESREKFNELVNKELNKLKAK